MMSAETWPAMTMPGISEPAVRTGTGEPGASLRQVEIVGRVGNG